MPSEIAEVRKLLQVLRKKGCDCPACEQFVKEYRRKLNSGMARSLIEMYKRGGTRRWVDVPEELDSKSREEGKLVAWKLIKPHPDTRDDGGAIGLYKVLRKGERFVLSEITIESHARFFNKKCLGLEGKQVSIQECLGKHFNYAELMAE